MLWSYWKGALAAAVLGGGLAWSQIPNSQPGANSDRIMTVHEDGKATRCRVVKTWTMPDGNTAYQLQALDTGEMMTIVQEGQASNVQGTQPDAKVKAVPMRIFHWGSNSTPPAGTPMPTGTPMPAGASRPQKLIPASGEVNSRQGASSQNVTLPGSNASKDAAGLDCTERVITWEDNNDRSTRVDNCNTMPISGNQTSATCPTAPMIGNNAARGVVPYPAARSTVKAPAPSAPARPMAQIQEMPKPVMQVQGKALSPAGEILWETMIDPVTGKEVYTVPPKNARQGKPPQQMAQHNPSASMPPAGEILWEKMIDPVTGKEVYTVPPKDTRQAKPPQQTAQQSKQLQPAAPQPKTGARTNTWFQPKTPVVAKPATKPEPASPVAPFSTAAPALPPVLPKPNALPLNIGHKEVDPALAHKKQAKPNAVPLNSGHSETPKTGDPDKAYAKQGPTQPERQWRDMWGKSADAKAQQPGQSLVEPPPPIRLPPSSLTEKNKADILMDPQRINSAENKNVPKVPALLPVPAAEASQTFPGGTPPTVSVPNPHLPGNWPIGAQSVLAAKNGHMNGMTYVPVPIATVPNPARLPAPPEPKLPEPPAPNNWVNAFSPPAKNDQNQQMMQNMRSQQMGGQLAMQPMPNPYMMAQGMPQNPMMAQQRPALNYMANYQGPGAPNPFQQQPVTPVQYQQPMPLVGFQPPMAPVQFQQQVNAVSPEAAYLLQLVAVLRESPYPAQREWAANTLATYDWRVHPQVVQVLIGAARQDPAATVRAGCVYSLSRMNAQIEQVTTTFETLRQDADPRVRQEAEAALARFKQ